jgi:acetyl esterase/lipase
MLLVVSALTCVFAADAMAAVTVRRAVVYDQGWITSPSRQRVNLLMDIYRPANTTATLPAAIFIHGGGFKDGSRDNPKAAQFAFALANRGIATASIDYRLSGQGPVLSDRVKPLEKGLPPGDFSRGVVAAVDDTLKAFYFLRRNGSQFGIDIRRIGLVGDSAGAMTADHIAYALDDYGIARPPVRYVASMWGGVIISAPNGTWGASMLDPGEAPLYAAHGDQDQVVPVFFSDQLVQRARAQGVPNEYHRLAGAGHDPPEYFTEPVVGDETSFDRMLDFAVAQSR